MVDIKRLREICEKATPGPWGVSGCGYDVFAETVPAFNDPSSRMVIAQCLTADDGKPFNLAAKIAKNDAKFIVAAHAALPEALDEIENLKQDIKTLTETLKAIASMYAVLGYDPEDAKCMSEMAREALKKSGKGAGRSIL